MKKPDWNLMRSISISLAASMAIVACHSPEPQTAPLRWDQVLDELTYSPNLDLKSVADTGKPVFLKLATGNEDNIRKQGMGYALRIVQAPTSTGKPWVRGQPYITTRDVEAIKKTPDPLILHSRDGKIKVSVKVDDIDRESLMWVGRLEHLQADDIPAEWLPEKIAVMKDCEFMVLPCNMPMDVAGTLWKTDDGYEMRGFVRNGFAQKVVVKTRTNW